MRAQHSKQYNEYQAVQQLHEFIVPGFVRIGSNCNLVYTDTHTNTMDGNGRRENQTKKEQRTNKIYTRAVYLYM